MNGALVWFLPFTFQGLAMVLDEFGFHPCRAMPRWEGLGHALDTAVFLGCLVCPLLLLPSPGHLAWFTGLAAASCLLITKDESVHRRLCSAGEHWIHAVLFILHPVVLIATAFLWMRGGSGAGLRLQALLVAGFLAFQLLWWAARRQPEEDPPAINNDIYEQLGERWYTATDDPVALLRSESRLRTSWVLAELRSRAGEGPLAILDVGCGGGFLANPLAAAGHAVTGIDLSEDSLEVARRHDPTGSVAYLPMDARALAFPDGRFDAVCMMDFLEHLSEKEAVIAEAARVLRPGGSFFFHTFNRTLLSRLVAIHGVAWFVKNTPEHMHVHGLFMTPPELGTLCARHSLAIGALMGVRPRVFSRAFIDLLRTGRVSDRFQFVFTRSLSIGYCGRATKAGCAG